VSDSKFSIESALTVIPAKAGTQGRKRTSGCPCSSQGQALDPCFRACEEIEVRRDKRGASFETAASQPPQDEGFS
jgi:hypothetical protein